MREWGWRFGYTSAQIDLMVVDQPVIDYGNGKKGMGTSAKDVKEMDDLAEAWKKKHGDGQMGKAVSLGAFMKG